MTDTEDIGDTTKERGIAVVNSRYFPPRIVETEGFERLFEHYTGLKGDELLKYLQDFQARALKVCPYACISNGGFAALRERAHDEYPAIIEYAKKGGHIVVDLGCCLGTDVREFLLDGGDANGSNKIVAVDLRQDFLDLGQELYNGPTKGIDFRAANLLDCNDLTLDDIKGKVTLLYTGAVFHLFQKHEQRVFARRIYHLLARDHQVVVFGLHRGSHVAGERKSFSSSAGGVPYAHSPESWKELWTDILGDDVKNWTINANLRFTWTPAENVNKEHPLLQWSLWRK